MELFSSSNINFDALRRKAFNFRWAEVEDGVIPLTAADPDFPVAPEIIGAITDYLSDGYLSYTPKLGMPQLRKAIAEDLCSRKNEGVTEDLVLPVDSAARGMYIIAGAVLEPGDEAIVMDPVDYLFKNSVMTAGGVPVYYPVCPDKEIDFEDLEDYITPKTRMFCLCNPHNPLGKVYSEKALEKLLEVCEKHGLWIMNDEIWSDMILGEKPFVSINSLGGEKNKKTLSVYGFSKAYGLAGLRVGCIYCRDREVFDRLVDASGVMTTAGGVSSLSQVAALAAITKARYWSEAFTDHLRGNARYAVKRLSAMPGIKAYMPDATYIMWLDVRDTGLSSQQFTDFMQEKVKLALVPGSEKMFGPGAEGCVRMCLATGREVLAEGLDRLEKGLEMIRRGE